MARLELEKQMEQAERERSPQKAEGSHVARQARSAVAPAGETLSGDPSSVSFPQPTAGIFGTLTEPCISPTAENARSSSRFAGRIFRSGTYRESTIAPRPLIPS